MSLALGIGKRKEKEILEKALPAFSGNGTFKKIAPTRISRIETEEIDKALKLASELLLKYKTR